MIIDLFVPYQENDEQPLDVALLSESVRSKGIDAVCLVSENEPPAEDSKAVQELNQSGTKTYRAATVSAGAARFWVLPPQNSDWNDIRPDTTGDVEPADLVQDLTDKGCAVLLCNPYARNLPGGELRDHAVYIPGIHGVLAMIGTAIGNENKLAQEFAMVRRLAAGGASAAGPDHGEFGRYLTLGLFEGELVEGIRSGEFLTMESTGDTFEPIEAKASHRGGDRGSRDGKRQGRNGGRDRGRNRSSRGHGRRS
ncbi:MAG: hypothetical protein CMH54_14625 [Myxococcales bacterium]|nr:hypothetical protein [Myxococcales bacterium]